MTLSKQAAEAALSDIEHAAGRGQTLRGYRAAGPVLVLWGVIWMIGYAAMGVLPIRDWIYAWLLLDGIGVGLSFMLSRRGSGNAGISYGGWSGLVVAVFIAVVEGCFQMSLAAHLVLPALVLGLVYVVMGLPRMRRFVGIGLAIFAASLIGAVFFQPWLCFWLAGVGGGGLVLGGLWLGRA